MYCASIGYACKTKSENVDHRYLEVSGEKPNFAPRSIIQVSQVNKI